MSAAQEGRVAAGASSQALHASGRRMRDPHSHGNSDPEGTRVLQDATAPAPYQAAEFAAAPAPYQAAEYAAQSSSSEESPAGEAQGSSSIQAEAANQPAYHSWAQQQAPTFGLVGSFPCAQSSAPDPPQGLAGSGAFLMKSVKLLPQYNGCCMAVP